MDRDDLELFEKSLRHATASLTGRELDAALAGIGWHDALAADPAAAVSTLFPLQGHANATSGALDAVLLDRLAPGTQAHPVLPALGSWHPPAERHGDRVAVHGLASAALAGAVSALVVVPGDRAAGGDDRCTAMAVPVDALDVRQPGGLDPSLGLHLVTGELPTDDTRTVETGPVDWQPAVRRCQLALGHELAGASRKMLELASEHALERVQFGQPIAAFQAVRHRLAESLVAVETAEAALAEAWEHQVPQAASMAKALAGRGARTAARHCQQVLAGIGFTLEHPFHHHLRRVLMLDELFGSARALTRDLGEQITRDGELPPVIPL